MYFQGGQDGFFACGGLGAADRNKSLLKTFGEEVFIC
jgi:hypothetical protein